MIAAAVLAAGQGSRYGTRPKLTEPLGGRAVVAWSLDAARGSGLAPVVLVLGREGDAVLGAAELADERAADLTIVRNEGWASGIASSLKTAIAALEPLRDVDGVVVGLGDQPAVGSEAYRRVGRAYDFGARLAVATYAGGAGQPGPARP